MVWLFACVIIVVAFVLFCFFVVFFFCIFFTNIKSCNRVGAICFNFQALFCGNWHRYEVLRANQRAICSFFTYYVLRGIRNIYCSIKFCWSFMIKFILEKQTIAFEWSWVKKPIFRLVHPQLKQSV